MARDMSNLKAETEDKICKKKLELKIAIVSDLQHLTKHCERVLDDKKNQTRDKIASSPPRHM